MLPFYMVVATYFCYETVCRTMRTAIVSNLLKFVNNRGEPKHNRKLEKWFILHVNQIHIVNQIQILIVEKGSGSKYAQK